MQTMVLWKKNKTLSKGRQAKWYDRYNGSFRLALCRSVHVDYKSYAPQSVKLLTYIKKVSLKKNSVKKDVSSTFWFYKIINYKRKDNTHNWDRLENSISEFKYES